MCTNYVQTKFGSPDDGMHIMELSQGNTPTAIVNEIAEVKEKRESRRLNVNICRRCFYLKRTLRGNSTDIKTMKPH